MAALVRDAVRNLSRRLAIAAAVTLVAFGG